MGALAQDVRGSLNGTTFSRNRGGAFVRSKVSPVQPVSRWSGQARSIFKACSQRWSSKLTDAQRSAWNAFAVLHPFVNVFSDSIVLPGVAFYASVNARLAQCGYVYLDDPPLTFVVEDAGILTINLTAEGTVLHGSVAVERALVPTEGMIVYMTPPLGPARALQATDLRMVNSANQVCFGSPVDLTPEIAARFPGVGCVVGGRYGVRVVIINTATGAISAPVGGVYTAVAP
jgi:hypothetical protein